LVLSYSLGICDLSSFESERIHFCLIVQKFGSLYINCHYFNTNVQANSHSFTELVRIQRLKIYLTTVDQASSQNLVSCYVDLMKVMLKTIQFKTVFMDHTTLKKQPKSFCLCNPREVIGHLLTKYHEGGPISLKVMADCRF
jgi:hypothetical protein